MTVASNYNRDDHVGDGATIEWDYNFKIFDKNDLVVIYTDKDDVDFTLTVDTDYTVSEVGNPNGGKVKLKSGGVLTSDTLTAQENLAILRVIPVTQKIDLRNQRTFFGETHEEAFDRAVMVLQQHDETLGRAAVLPDSVSADDVDPTLPKPVAGRTIGWDSTKKALENKESSGGVVPSGAEEYDSILWDGAGSVYRKVPNYRETIANFQGINPADYTLKEGDRFHLGGRGSAGDGAEGVFRITLTDISTEVGKDEVTTGGGDGGIYIAFGADKTGASGGIIRLDAEIANAGWYADTGATDNADALEAMYTSTPDSVRYDAFFPVTGNFGRDNIPHVGEGGVTIGGTNIPLNTERTRVPVTVYVNPAGDDTNNHGLSSTNPFKTIQRAYDSLPAQIDHQQTIELADATHTGNYLDPGVESNFRLPRAAVLFGRGKSLSPRSQANAGDMSAAVVIRSAGGNKANCIIETDATYTYGIYNAHGQIGLQDLTLQAGATADTLLASHRSSSYVHCYDVDVKANGQTVGSMLLAESGGMIEYTGVDWDIDGGTTSLQMIGRGSTINLSGTGEVKNNTTAVAGKNGELVVSVSAGADSDWFLSSTNGISGENMDIHLLGKSDKRVGVDVVVQSENCRIATTYVDFKQAIRPENCMLHFDATNYQSQLTLRGGLLRLRGTDSFISPATENDSASPIRNEGGVVTYEGTNNIVGQSSGHPTLPITSFNATGNGETYTPSKDVKVYRMNGNGANRTGGTLGVASDDFRGREIIIYGDTWGIEITSSATCDVPASFTLGSGTGSYAAARFVLSDAGVWVGTTMGPARP